MADTIPPLTPLHNTSGETYGSIKSVITGPVGGTRGIAKPRYNANVGEPAAEEAPGRPATMKGIDVTTINDPYEHERGSGKRTLAPTMHRGG